MFSLGKELQYQIICGFHGESLIIDSGQLKQNQPSGPFFDVTVCFICSLEEFLICQRQKQKVPSTRSWYHECGLCIWLVNAVLIVMMPHSTCLTLRFHAKPDAALVQTPS